MKDKVVLVTGGSSGIGRAAAFAFAQEGAKVVVAARDASRLEEVVGRITADGGDAVFVRTDVSKAADVEALVEQTIETYGRLDCAFNNAATEGVLRDTADVAEEEFDRVVGVNLKGVWLCMKHELRQMVAQEPPGGAIVNTSSVNGLGGVPMGAIYSATKCTASEIRSHSAAPASRLAALRLAYIASGYARSPRLATRAQSHPRCVTVFLPQSTKAGVLALTKSAAQEYARHGIRVNALVAGAFDTPMLESVWQQYSAMMGVTSEDVGARLVSHVPMRRVGRPEEAAKVAVWLCSDAASYVTGHSMIADGGLTSPVR